MKNDEIALYENERISTVVDWPLCGHCAQLYENERISTVVDTLRSIWSASAL